MKKIHSQSKGKRKGNYQSLLRIKKLSTFNKRELLTNNKNCIYNNSAQQELVTYPILKYSSIESNLSVNQLKRQPIVSLNINNVKSENVEKLISVYIKPVTNQILNHCCSQNKRKTNFKSMCKNNAEVYRTGDNDILQQQQYQEDGFQQNESKNVVINLNCRHDVTLNIYGCKHESEETTNQEFATEWPNYEVLCGSGVRKQHQSYNYQQKCYFY